MNTRFNGDLDLHRNGRRPRGLKSKAAKQAFKDIRADKDMRVYDDRFGVERKVSIILNENILTYE